MKWIWFYIVALKDFAMILIDLNTKTIMRYSCGHKEQLINAAFSFDTRWLIISSMDHTIKG